MKTKKTSMLLLAFTFVVGTQVSFAQVERDSDADEAYRSDTERVEANADKPWKLEWDKLNEKERKAFSGRMELYDPRREKRNTR